MSAVVLFDVNGNPLTTLSDGSLLVTLANDGYSNIVNVSNFPIFPTSFSVSNFPVLQAVTTTKSSTSAVTSVASSVTVVTLLAANTNRIFAHISNALPNKSLYLKLGTAASETSFTELVLQGDSYDVPNDYTGVVTGIWATGVNALGCLITELTP